MKFGPNVTDLHSSPKERQLQKSCVSFGEECRIMSSATLPIPSNIAEHANPVECSQELHVVAVFFIKTNNNETAYPLKTPQVVVYLTVILVSQFFISLISEIIDDLQKTLKYDATRRGILGHFPGGVIPNRTFH